MMKYRIIGGILLSLFLSMLLMGCSAKEDSKEATEVRVGSPITTIGERTFLDIAYGEHPQQKYDLYLPANPSVTTTKTIVLIHGGGWTSGDKIDMNPFVKLLQQNHPSLAIVNVNYVLAGPGKPAFPNQREDIIAAFEHIKAKYVSYKIGLDFAILGTSAGAHLGMLYGLDKTHHTNIKMIANIVGPTDFTDPAYLEAETKELQDILKALQGNVEVPEASFLKEFSPVFLVHAQVPPVISFYGNKDPLIPNSQHERLEVSLQEGKVFHELTIYDGGHADWKPTSYADLNLKLGLFIKKHLE